CISARGASWRRRPLAATLRLGRIALLGSSPLSRTVPRLRIIP
ncbi:hypothetical protein AB1N83_006811, partial [Pleurotus pulmonarius]